MEKKKTPNILQSDSDKRVRVQAVKDKSKFLYHSKIPFSLVRSGSTYEIKSALWNDKAFISSFLPEEVTFIRSVKHYVLKNHIADSILETDYKALKIDYIRVNNYQDGDMIEDVMEIDVNAAYWQTAYNMGLISAAIYKRGLEINKIARLASLGSLAKVTEEWVFDGEKMELKPPMSSFATENIWFAICKRVSDIMNKAVAAAGKGFVFYWVDGIYVKNDAETISRLIQYFSSIGYEVKMSPVANIKFRGDGFDVQGAIQGDVKNFCYPIAKTKNRNIVSRLIEHQRLSVIAHELLYGKSK